ncbi:Methionine aminopeptidase 2 [Coemansia thaxteri]|uniref:Methionine aminopeptidase 2 n=1 Tax=Coemansia thaxteri TaxID=2663907 RepID=A0A9W8EF92_9FUNG|nr:Methionine aminopeptidase 2 [Coemansia thaxteri]KAJ2003240.1 Methionine aminopeptidase 2 [Coemansia thaxteri]KAJ2466680.1 Methionine aminopeptidase 2 [Coemansia sp. RSA 2322]KAJ2485315.1 Methionine aminopeptidase 2 [Coemansia sp. RSA 2320]
MSTANDSLPGAPASALEELTISNEASHDEEDQGGATLNATKKKKKKSKKSKKKAGAGASGQSSPPTIPVSQLFPNNSYPHGQLCDYVDDNNYRTTSEEMRAKDRLNEQQLTDLRRAAEVHREVRQYARQIIRPGMDLTTIAEMIENGTRALVEERGFEAGVGFPTGLSINHCAAHYTPNAGDHVVVQDDDVLKVDFGVHVNGHIVDSAFTLAWNDRYAPLLNAVREATNTGIREAGIDVRLGDIGAAIQEVMESYEIVLDGKTIPIKPIRNLCGHNIGPYLIHSGKSVPIVNNNDQTRMEEGELFAIETFGSTGSGYVQEEGVCSHYSKAFGDQVPLPRLQSAKKLLHSITKNFGTLPFCRRYLDRLGESHYYLGLKHLVDSGIVNPYPPLCDVKGSYTAQFEHTFILRPNVKEVLSRGEDY